MNTKTYKNDLYLFPKEPEEKIAHLLLPSIAAYFTELTNAQFEFLGIGTAGPFKPEWHHWG